MPTMRIGARAHDYGKLAPEALAQTLRAAGFDAVQLALPKAIAGIESYRAVTPAQLAETRAAFEKNDIEITVLGCYQDISSPDGEARAAAVENIRCSLGHAKLLGAKMVGSETAYPRLDGEEKARRRPLMTDSVLRIVETAARLDVVFAVEPVRYYPLDTAKAAAELFAAVGDAAHLKMIFDPSNVLNAADIPRQTALWQEWLERTGPQIATLHIKDVAADAAGQCVQVPLGAGELDYTLIKKWHHDHAPGMTMLRDEVLVEYAAADIAYIRAME